MDCNTCQESFSALLEDTAAAPPAAREHLANCAACTADFASFGDTVRHLRGLPVMPAPRELPRRIAYALDEIAASGRSRWALWQPLTAGLSMAACLALVLWAAVLSPVNVGWDTANPPEVYNAQTTSVGLPIPTASPAPSSAPSASYRPAGVRRFAVVRPGVAGRGEAMKPPSFGSWGEKIAQLSSASVQGADTGTGKPARTFAAEDPVTPVAPLHPQAGEVQIAFTPPVDKLVGLPVVGELTIVGQAEAEIVLRVTAPQGLRVLRAPQGVVYEGPLRKGETLRVPVRLMARQAGSYTLRVQLQSEVPGVATELEIVVPGFTGATGKNEPGSVSLRFRATPSLRAIRELAAAAGARVVVHEDVETQSVTLDFSAGVPFAAALRILCDDCGYRIEERDGVYHVLR